MGLNVLQMINMMRSGNPQQVAMNLIQQNMGSNPMAGNLMQMIQNNDAKGIETMARNLAREKGIDVNQALSLIGGQFNG